MTYTKIEYYENGKIKTFEASGFFLSFSGNIEDIKQKMEGKQ